MRAAVYLGDRSIGLVERDVPEPPPGWVRIGVTSAGICGSDLHVYHAALGDPAGMRPGHEVAGIVDAVGEGCTIAPGSHVAVEPIVACGSCAHCRAGRSNLCPTNGLIGFAHPGGLAEYVCAPEHTLHRLPDDLGQAAAGLSEPMAVCVRGTRIGTIGDGDRVAVVGAGSIGLLSILTARDAGASEIVVAARHPHQQELARHFGADAVFADTAAVLAEIGDDHVDVVVETVGGDADTVAESVSIARRGGRIVVLGVFTGTVGVPGMPWFSKELTLAASNCYGREREEGDFELAARLVATHADRIEPLVTHTFPLDEVAAAFATADDKSTRAIKVQLRPGA